jgi:two-component system sensor histidine kinase KdpD
MIGGPPLSGRRRVAGFAVALSALPVLSAVAYGIGMALSDVIVLFLAVVVGVALAGGLGPALLAAVGGFLLLNYFFTPPVRSLAVDTRRNLLALVVFVVVGIGVSWIVDLAERRTRQAELAARDAHTLATVAGGVLGGADPLVALLCQLRDTLALASVSLLERVPEGGWKVAAAVGGPVAESPAEGDVRVPADDDRMLVLSGRQLAEGEERIVRAFAAQAALALTQKRLAVAAEGDRVRSALLAAVSHDLRTPLASARAAVEGLRADGVEYEFDARDRDELLATASESLDRLTDLVTNLLDMSRLQAGTLGMNLVDVGLEDIVPRALDELGDDGSRVVVRLNEELCTVRADPGLLVRVLVNLLANAVRYSPPGSPPCVTTGFCDPLVELRVADHGPGIPAADRERVFLPFQRLGDRHNHQGVGLGLALSRGLTEAMGGTLLPEPTPGGGVTMVVSLPCAHLPARFDGAS